LDKKLSLDAFLSESYKAKIASQNSSYSLKSLVHHHGNTASSGHYTADALRGDTWVSFDDGVTSETTLDDIVDTKQKQEKVYMLMYSLE
jgi:ubiquitin C-terminal hydrolase